MHYRRSTTALMIAATLSACLPGATIRPPQAPIRSELAPRAVTVPIPSSDGPLQVVFASPRDDAPSASEISIVFNKPIRPIGIDDGEFHPPLLISPPTAGTYRWIGTTAFKFLPKSPFRRATTYRIEVPRTLQGADGKTLDEPFVFTFSTDRPEISGSEPEADAVAVRPDASITLYFNTPINAAEIERTVSIRASKTVAYTIAAIDDDHVVLKPRAPLPRNAEVTVHIDGSLRSTAGELPMKVAKDIRFRTLGPFSLASIECDPHPTEKETCNPDAPGVNLRLTTPIAWDLMEQAVAIDPAPESFYISDIGDNNQGAVVIHIDGSFEPGKTYSVGLHPTISGRPLLDVFGQPLAKATTRKLRYGDLPAEVIFGASGVYWLPGKRTLPVGVLNARDAAISMVPLQRDDVLGRLTGQSKPLAALADAKTFAPTTGKRNETEWTRIKVDDLLPPPKNKGPALARATFRASSASEVSVVEREVQLTDLGLFTKTTSDQAFVWATRLSNASALSGANVRAYAIPERGNAIPLGSFQADAQGMALFPIQLSNPRPARMALFVEHGDDWAYQTVDLPRAPEPVGELFTGRGIYRPGERVTIKGIARYPTTNGLTTPKGGEVSLGVIDATGREVISTQRKFTKFGTFAADLSIADDAPLGNYLVEARFDGYKFRQRFTVDHYQPVQTRAFVTADKEAYFNGDRMACTARGEYLYGAPMTGASAKVAVSRGAATINIDGMDKFQIGPHDVYPPNAQLTQASSQLDSRGSFSLPILIALPGQIAPERITCDASITDLDKQVQYASTSAIVHPADVYVALAHPPESWIKPGSTITPQALVVTPAGMRQTAKVHLDVFVRKRREDHVVDEQPIGSCDVTTGKTPAGCSFQVPKEDVISQDEVVVRGVTTDAKGRKAMTSYQHYLDVPTEPVVVPPPPPPIASAPPSKPSEPPVVHVPPPELSISTDYLLHVGKTARIVLESPYPKPATALVTFEREGILFRRVVELAPAGTKTTLDVPITAAMMPSMRMVVSAILGFEVKTDWFEVAVDSSSRKLTVDIGLGKTTTTPGDTLNVDVVVKDSEGKPVPHAEVTLWAEDEGSLLLGRYHMPNPAESLFEGREWLVKTADARDQILTTWMLGGHRVKPPQVRMGATSVSPRRGDFRQSVAYWPDLVTDAQGRVNRKVKLPDGLTEYRFMAVAVTEDDRTGAGRNSVQTFTNFMAKPSLPRVIRAGDEFDASVVLSALDAPKGKATVVANSKNLTAKGPLRQVVEVGPDSPAAIKFPMKAEHTGKVEFSIDASLEGKESDAVDLKHVVLSPTPLETTVVAGETTSALAERIAQLRGIRPDTGELSISFSPSPLTSLVSGIEQLVEYPHGCTEQTVSRMVPLLAARDIATAFDMPLAKTLGHKSIPEALQHAVDLVVANQQKGGGFGLWSTSREFDPWVTAYALWGLSEASRRGVNVPKEALERAARALEPTLSQIEPSTNGATLDQAAFALDVLAMQGRAAPEKIRALWAERSRLSTDARSLVLHAIATQAPSMRTEIDALLADVFTATRKESSSSARVIASGARKEFASDVISTAMALRALVVVDPKHPLLAQYAAHLLQARSGGRYETTHDAAWALLALDAYRTTLPEPKIDFDARVFLSGNMLAETHFNSRALQGKTIRLPMQEVMKYPGSPLTFEVLGGGHLFYEVVLKFAREEESTQAADAGFFVTKSIMKAAEYDQGMEQKDEPEFAVGETVVCEVEVVSAAARTFVVVEDPLAGGFEPVPLDRGQLGVWAERMQASPADRREMRDDRVVWFIDRLPAGVSRFRYLARAMYSGRFIAPPTRAEQMYVPAIWGQTAATRVRIIGDRTLSDRERITY